MVPKKQAREQARLKETGADWRAIYADLTAEIKLRHYSPKTLKAYSSWEGVRKGLRPLII
jgi:hypothetical protein